MATGDLTFDSVSLQDSNIVTAVLEDGDLAEVTIVQFPLALSDGVRILGLEFGAKQVRVSGYIIGSSVSNVETLWDTFTRNLVKTSNKNLDIEYASSTRRYKAMIATLSQERPVRSYWLKWQLTFLASRGYGEATSATTVSVTNQTASPTDQSITFTGSKSAFPKITITLDSFTGAATREMTLKNNSTGLGITVSRSGWANADVVVIDPNPDDPKVTVNGTQVDFSGVFPEFAPGTALTLRYTDTFSARQVDISTEYTPRYF